MKRLTAIAISGGIDSLVAAYLLKEHGHKVVGIHFTTGYETGPTSDIRISHIADQLGISIKIIDCSVEFKKEVIDYFIQTYLTGQTPNPCIVCNQSIKFGKVLASARQLGASCLATGHYARIIKDEKDEYHLLRGIDLKKEQSYFLSLLTQKQLSDACFPLGSMTKPEVIKLAEKKGLSPVTKKESQDICFIRNKTYGEFIAKQQGFTPKPGNIEDVYGNILGKHKGLHLFTIGQRRGINCPARQAYYVVNIDSEKNRLVVGLKKDMEVSECKVVNINWINQKPGFPKPDFPIKVYTRVRYRHKAALSMLFPVDNHTAIVRFENPQSAITPGQCAVFYQDDEVLGGGWIDKL